MVKKCLRANTDYDYLDVINCFTTPEEVKSSLGWAANSSQLHGVSLNIAATSSGWASICRIPIKEVYMGWLLVWYGHYYYYWYLLTRPFAGTRLHPDKCQMHIVDSLSIGFNWFSTLSLLVSRFSTRRSNIWFKQKNDLSSDGLKLLLSKHFRGGEPDW